MTEKQSQQKAAHDRHSKSRQFHVGQSIMARNLRPGPKWIPGIIVQSLRPLSFLIETRDGQLWRKHMDHLKPVHSDQEAERGSTRDGDSWELPSTGRSYTHETESTTSAEGIAEHADTTELPSGSEPFEANDSSNDSDTRRYPPEYYGH